jgi:hypothetical protein
MSCDAAAAAAYLFLASAQASSPVPATPVVAVTQQVAQQPLFADIVQRAGRLRSQVERYRTPRLKASAGAEALPGFDHFQTDIGRLAALDMQGHEELARSGSDGDLKCILKGISQDLGVKMKTLLAAPTGAAQDLALRDMGYLLRDNVEVITAPPAPPA